MKSSDAAFARMSEESRKSMEASREASRKSMEETPEFNLRQRALEIFAHEIENDVAALWVELTSKSTSTIKSEAQQRRGYEVVAVMKQRFQQLEKSVAHPRVSPLKASATVVAY